MYSVENEEPLFTLQISMHVMAITSHALPHASDKKYPTSNESFP